MHRRFTLLMICAALAAGAGCDKFLPKAKEMVRPAATSAVVTKGPLVAKVNNYPISKEDLDEEITSFNTLVSESAPERKITTRDKKVDYLKNEMVRRVLLYQEAQARGLERNEEIRKILEKTKMDLLVVELAKQETQKIEVSAKEIEDAYNAYKDQFKEPEERQLREIGLPTETEAKEVLIQILQGADFAALARDRSRLPTAKNGGDTGYIVPGKRFPRYDSEAFSENLEPGKNSPIFKGTDGYYYIIKLENKRGGTQKTLNQMWEEIKRFLQITKQQQRIDELIAKLSREAKIELFEGEIK